MRSIDDCDLHRVWGGLPTGKTSALRRMAISGSKANSVEFARQLLDWAKNVQTPRMQKMLTDPRSWLGDKSLKEHAQQILRDNPER